MNGILVSTFILTLLVVPPAAADGSSSTSRRPAAAMAQPGDYDLAVRAVQSGEYERALASLQKVVGADPRNADAWNYIGYSQRKLRRFDESLAAYRKALDLDPDHRGANEYLGELYLQTGQLEKARERLVKLKGLCPKGCAEYDDLQEAVATYQLAQKRN